MKWRIRRFDELASTNDEVKRAIEAGEPEGLAVRALRQTRGYGRQGRAWQSPAGGLYFSMLLRPSAPAGPLSTVALVAGLAMQQALLRFVSDDVACRIRVKWPNDIVVLRDGAGVCSAFHAGAKRGTDFRSAAADGARFLKLCGISSELHRGALCIGVGVNVAPSPIAAGGKNAPAYLADLSDGSSSERLEDGEGARGEADAEKTCAALFEASLEEFGSLYGRWLREGFAPFARSYGELEALRGSRVEMADLSGGILASGKAAGVADDGRLLLLSDDGSLVPVSSGEAHIL